MTESEIKAIGNMSSVEFAEKFLGLEFSPSQRLIMDKIDEDKKVHLTSGHSGAFYPIIMRQLVEALLWGRP